MGATPQVCFPEFFPLTACSLHWPQTIRYLCQVNFFSPTFCVAASVHPSLPIPDALASTAWLEGADRGGSWKKLGQILKMQPALPQTSAWGKTARPQTSPWFSLQKLDLLRGEAKVEKQILGNCTYWSHLVLQIDFYQTQEEIMWTSPCTDKVLRASSLISVPGRQEVHLSP